MGEPWFRPKRYGYGAEPASWQGWAATVGFIAATAGLAYGTLGGAGEGWALFFVLYAPLLLGFLWLVRRKSTGTWRFRWGARDE